MVPGTINVSGRLLTANLANFGFAVVGIFIASWLISTAVCRLKGHESIAAAPP